MCLERQCLAKNRKPQGVVVEGAAANSIPSASGIGTLMGNLFGSRFVYWRGRLPNPSEKSCADLKAHCAHLFQEELSSTINLHLDRFR
jgi:hypothetical protein